MIKRLTFSAILSLTASLATAQGLEDMTDSERSAFREEVRAYLLENPEVLQEAITVLQQRQDNAQVENDIAMVQANAEALFNDGHSFVGGNPEGDITVIEFMDYRCGFCKRAFPEVKELIGSDANIRYVVKEFPILGEESVLAAQFAIATQLTQGDETYELVHNTLMEFQGSITETSLQRLGETLEIDTDAIFAEMDSDEVTQIITENRALAQKMQITGTPTFVFEDQMVRGYVPLAQMQSLVDSARADL